MIFGQCRSLGFGQRGKAQTQIGQSNVSPFPHAHKKKRTCGCAKPAQQG